MDETELKSIISNEIQNSLGIDGSALSDERLRLQQYYEGQLPAGNGITDRSQIKDRAVLEVIHWLMPQLMAVFTSSDNIITFEPRNADDVALAKQITQYVNFILHEDNEGYKLIYELIKTCLIQKNSFVQCAFEDQPQIQMNFFTGLGDQELHALMMELEQGDKYEIKDQRDYPDPTWMPPPPQMIQMAQAQGQAIPPEALQAPMMHDLRCKVWNSEGRVVLRHVLPEEVLISRRMPSTNFNGDHFVAHRVLKTVSDLRLLDYDEDLIQEAKGEDAQEWNIERVSRFSKDESTDTNTRTDEAMQPVWLTECFLKVDYDDDGIAELRRVVTARDGAIIFENSEADEVPLINFTPILEPGRAIGMSVAELVVDLQETKTALSRGVMDSLYLSIVPRNVININKLTEDTFDDLDEGRPGDGIRVNDDGAITPLVIPFIGAEAQAVMEAINQQIATRTGVGPQNNIISPDVLNNQTAAGISMTQSAASGQIELICRTLAHTGFRELARHILGLVVRHQDKPRMIRLNGEFVEMDPRFWHENFDVSVSVGIGTGNKEKTTRDLQGLLMLAQPLVEMQKGLNGPYITAPDLHVIVGKLTDAMGYKEDFFPHLGQPAQQPGQGQQQNPEVMKAQAEIQVMQQKAQVEAALKQKESEASMALEDRKAQHAMELEQFREKAKAEREMMRLQAEITMDANRPVKPA